MDLKKHGNVDWINLAHYRGHWDISWAHHNESQDSEINLVSVALSRRTQLRVLRICECSHLSRVL